MQRNDYIKMKDIVGLNKYKDERLEGECYGIDLTWLLILFEIRLALVESVYQNLIQSLNWVEEMPL